MKRFLKLTGSAVLAITILFGAGASVATAASSVNCSGYPTTECDFWHSEGIQSIQVIWYSPMGPIFVVDEQYNDCPANVTEAISGSDYMQGEFDFNITPCEPVSEPEGNTNGGLGLVYQSKETGGVRFKTFMNLLGERTKSDSLR